MNREQTVEVLLEVARRAMNATSATHPVDIANVGSWAIESAGEAVDVISKQVSA